MNRKIRSTSPRKTAFFTGLLLTAGLFASTAQADNDVHQYRVTITNLTHGQTFTPIMVASHKRSSRMFSLGAPTSSELAILAESGNPQPLSEKLMPYDVASSDGLLGPGESASVMVKTHGPYRYLSVAAMLIPTNDGFFAVNGIRAPQGKRPQRVMSPVYDAGSEINDELCANIPGPYCGGSALSPEDGEGYVHIHPGMHGIGDLMPSQFDWRNPAAKITIQRVH